MLFTLHCRDKKDSLPLRMATREAHLAFMRERLGIIRLSGPMLDDSDRFIGSLIILDVANRAEAEAFAATDPYALAGLFEEVRIDAFRPAFGGLA